MEINSEKKHLKPAEFTQIRAMILERAHNHCEFCGVPNGLCVTDGHGWYPVKLTIAHMDHDKTNNDPSNLRVLCQRCYNNFNAKYHNLTLAKQCAASGQPLDIPFDY